jgi:hypothetical protein
MTGARYQDPWGARVPCIPRYAVRSPKDDIGGAAPRKRPGSQHGDRAFG